MHRLRGLITVLFVVAVGLSSILLEPVSTSFNQWFGVRFDSAAARIALIAGFALLITAAFLWERWRNREILPASYVAPVHLRRAVIDRVLDRAGEWLDNGLYHRAHTNFKLVQRPLTVTTLNSEPLNTSIDQHYRNLDGPLIILEEAGDLPRFSQPVITEDLNHSANSLGVR